MRRYLSIYSLLVLVPVLVAVCALVWFTDGVGAGASGPAGGHGGDTMYRLLLATSAVVALAAAGGALARRCGQPKVVGELLAGLVLGPSAFGAIAPGAQRWLFPEAIVPHLETLAQFGVVFFMFLVGAELPAGTLRRSGPKGLIIGHASIALPFLMGLGTAWWLHAHHPPVHSGTVPYLLFVALSFSITAFPVLARILSEQRLLKTPLGATGMTAAGVGDVTAWGLLAVVIALIRGTSPFSAVLAIALVTVFAMVMFLVVRPLVARAVRLAEEGRVSRVGLCAALVCLILVSSLATDRIGLHAIFGPFLAGAVMPRNSPLVNELTSRIYGLTMWFMLPLFFVTIGLGTHLGSLGPGMWLTCLLVVAVAVAGKVLSAASAAAVVGGHTRNEALALGVMMNCRGLTELVVLNLGVELGVLGPDLFAVFVFMALVTTAMTGPLLRRTLRTDGTGGAVGGRERGEDGEDGPLPGPAPVAGAGAGH
jgi:Kef-type K+ transport system membrane component KefB